MGETAQSTVQPDSLTQASTVGLDSTTQAVAMTPEQAEAVAAGDALFKGNCAQCHAVNDVVVGPALMGLDKRRPERWLLSWIKNSSKMVASGDEYAVKIFNQYGKQQMPSFLLSDAEIRQILTYAKSQEATSVAEYSNAVAVVK
ncbi:c-type cytochrome [Hymenobacter fodinae]|uniref:C-type cytochrome n=2 Tax=Hymenobacter fodinae TaxID=2510796 RepID=A0A4Z0PBR4_9BACT|nr:c-type cytochrome [Hymenobacter fodinae]